VDPLSRQVLELEKVEAILAEKTSSPYGVRRVRELRPYRDAALLEAELRFVQEMKDVAAAHGRPFGLDTADLDGTLARCRVEGATLDPESLMNISKALRLSEELSSFVAEHSEDYQELARRTRELFPVPPLRGSIDRCIDSVTGGVADACSRHLREVRREKERVRSQTLQALERILSKQSAKTDDFVTVRSERYVIPVDSRHRSSVRGIVHDTSSSGATLFVEPLEVVEYNNRLTALSVMEKEEENRLLSELTARVGEHAEVIERNLEVLGEVDFGRAKASLSAELKCTAPTVSAREVLRLVKARHPLLILAKGHRDVVPLDLEMGVDFRTLVISGPNMGGKTVALKTVGLLALMMACGLHVPAGDGTELPLFEDIYADIGDRQSIEEDLSTFAAHVQQLARIVKAATAGSLVLLDEVGAGTDPHEGGALARSMLRFLTDKRAFCVATTHLGTLKPFVAEGAGMANACMEFDSEALSPKYALHVGSPGRSMALEMASKLGLPRDLIEDARSQLSAGELKMDALLADAEVARGRARELEVEAESARREANELRVLLEERVEDLSARRRELERKARDSCKQMVSQTRAELESLLRETKKAARSERAREALRQVEALEDRLTEPVESDRPAAKSLTPGEEFFVNSLGVRAALLKVLPGGRALVERRGVRLEVPVSELREPDGGEPAARAGGGYSAPPPREEAAEIEVRGMTGDEAAEAVERQLDAAVLQGLGEIRIIHGKGTGVLRTRVARELSRHPAVADFRLGEIWEGGTGVTVVKLK
jgi:DNA mismatch repair protein MutS2